MSERAQLSRLIKQKASELGFAACGITRATAVADVVRDEFSHWIDDGCHGTMSYMAGHYDKRMNPAQLVEGCRSIIVVAQNYYTPRPIPYISRYAQGRDYHKVVKEKLFLLIKYINELTPVTGRAFCDSAPVLERYWAVQAGLGWCGKSRQLIIPGAGTHFFLGELLVDIELEYDEPYTESHCGGCTACIDACPGRALSASGLDARKCLSYLTIEHRGDLPQALRLDGCFYGCDKCQSVCPHNRFAKPHAEAQFFPHEELSAMQPDDWKNLAEEQFNIMFKDSAVQRCGYTSFIRNIRICDFLTKNNDL